MRPGPVTQERGWPLYLGSATRAGTSADTMARDPQPAWRARVARGVIGSPAVGEGVLAFAQTDRQVSLVDRATGDVFWRRRLERAPGGGPLLADDRLVVAEQGRGGRVRALRLADGRELWSRAVGDVAAPLATRAGGIYAAALDGQVTSLRLSDGSVRWRTKVAGGIRTAPVPAGNTLIVATVSDSMFALEDSGGVVRLRRATRGTVLAAPALADTLLVFGTTAGRLEAAHAATLRPLWTLDLPDAVVGSVAVRGSTVYVLTARGLLVAVSLAGPEAGVRRAETGLVARAGPMPVPGGVFVTGLNGEIVWLSAALERRWSARVEAPLVEPVLVDGRTLLAVSQRGDVVAFR